MRINCYCSSFPNHVVVQVIIPCSEILCISPEQFKKLRPLLEDFKEGLFDCLGEEKREKE